MSDNRQTKLKKLISSRRENPAWRLLASPIAPSIIYCLRDLFDSPQYEGIEIDTACIFLSETLQVQDNNELIDMEENSDFLRLAKRELKDAIKRGLISDRGGKIYATNALQKALRFIDDLDNSIMTSTASRLATVQQAINQLNTQLNPSPEARINELERRIETLNAELQDAREGIFETIEGDEAVEQIQDVYQLASSLKSDFRRVEDAYRDADRRIRHSIINEEQHRGQVVDKLLDGHETLLNTPEGRVFHSFHNQLSQEIELENMSTRLKTILIHPEANKALTSLQTNELKNLKSHLVNESESVIRARARSEQDVKAFVKSGIAAEQHKAGKVLKEIFSTSLDIDWTKKAIRCSEGPLPPIAFNIGQLPVIERFTIKSIHDDVFNPLNFEEQSIDLNEIDTEFWAAFDNLNREELVSETLTFINSQADKGITVTIKNLAERINPEHDLESIALWINMATEANITKLNTKESDTEYFSIKQGDKTIIYTVPLIEFNATRIAESNKGSFLE